MAKDFHELPRLEDSLSYLYLEMCRIEQDEGAIAAWDLSGVTPIPIASLNCLLLGPGTVITQAAMRAIGENGCNVCWVGEQGVRMYACATGETRSARHLLRQAMLATREPLRLRVVSRMYRMRFRGETLPEGLTLQQIRGREGVRVREAYASAAKACGIPWGKRQYDRHDWDAQSDINKALSSAAAALYGICHAAIVAMGYSTGLGFIHSGKQLSFVYDIADLYRMDLVVPTAFRAVSEQIEELTSGDVSPKGRLTIEQRTRFAMRDAFRRERLLQRIPKDIAHCLAIPVNLSEIDPWADDSARPSELWTPSTGEQTTLHDDRDPGDPPIDTPIDTPAESKGDRGENRQEGDKGDDQP